MHLWCYQQWHGKALLKRYHAVAWNVYKVSFIYFADFISIKKQHGLIDVIV